MTVKKTFRVLFALTGMVMATMSLFAFTGQKKTAYPFPISHWDDDSSKHKSLVNKCANFGNVYCSGNEAGGICGNVNTSNIRECSNTGNASIPSSGYATTSRSTV